jgi:multidrug efflux pump subunit AcrA (membrane-fusion protein)
MKHLFVLCLVILAGLLLAACGTAVGQAAAPSTPIPTVGAESVIVAEGRLEPIRYAEIAFTASGVISEVLVQEGEAVKKGQPLIHLGNESDTNYAAAQLEYQCPAASASEGHRPGSGSHRLERCPGTVQQSG